MPEAIESEDEPLDSISASSEREALDWSLVLLSQGIESTLLHDPPDAGWQLLVPAGQRDFAWESIRLYQHENRAWPLRHDLPWAGFTFDWTAILWVALMAAFYLFQSQPGSSLEAAGICDPVKVRAHEWWRLLTATMLHADPGHLTANAVFGGLLLGIAMGRLGSGVALLTATLAGTLANFFAISSRDDRISSLGASGIIMAALGLLAADAAVQQWRRRQPRRIVFGAIASALMLFAFVGVSPHSDIAAHAGGLVAGLLLGIPLALVPLTTIRQAKWNFLAGTVYGMMVTAAWWWALAAFR